MAFINLPVPAVTQAGQRSRRATCPNMVYTGPAETATKTERTCKVRVEEPNGKSKMIEVQAGTNLRRALIDAKVDVYAGFNKLRNCGGNAVCGLCTVEVLEQDYNLSPMTVKEEFLMTGKPVSWRLACRAELQGDVTLRTKPQ